MKLPLLILYMFFMTNVQAQTKFDSSKYYWSKQVCFEGKMNKLIDAMNKMQSPIFDKRILPLADSCEKYKRLLEKYKK